MSNYAQIDGNGVCIGVSTLAGAVSSPHLIPIVDEDVSLVGRRWTGSEWEDVPVAEPEPTWKITKLAFKNRFPRAKWIAARQAALSDAMLFDFFESFDLATYIDLERQDTRDGVLALSMESVPETMRLTPEEVAAAIDVPATQEELPSHV